jgi:uncharacterized alpha-E superfamily protein
MLSRVAESVYWLSRYIERAENVARFIEVNMRLILDLPISQAQQWEPLVITSGDEEDFKERYDFPTQDNVIHFLTFDLDNPNSILSCLSRARENARSVREIISQEMWEQVNWFHMTVRAASTKKPGGELPADFFSKVKMASHLFCGITDNTLSHTEAWNFARLARMFERADKTARILDVKYFMLLPQVDYVGTPYDTALWTALLKSASAFEMYRQQFGQINSDKVAQFLILDREFPRSMRFCVHRADDSLRAITGSPIGSYNSVAERRIGRLRSELDYAQIAELVRGGLHEFIDDFQINLNSIGEAVYESFFAMRRVPEHLSQGQTQFQTQTQSM